MSVKAGITVDRSAWIKELLRLRRKLCRYVRRYYGIEAYEALLKRFSGALDIIRDSRRISSIIVRGSSVTMIVVSSKGVEEGVERVVIERSLHGGELIERRVGVPLEEAYHVVQVGAYGMKCTCTDAVMTASRADREFERRLRGLIRRLDMPMPIFTKYVLCKHTLAALAYAFAAGVIKSDSRVINEVIKLAVKALILRVKGGDSLSKSTILRMYKTLLRLSKGLPP